jgi:hypothetical protein
MSEPLTQHLLGAPIVLERAIRNANFFNGRVLTARDMQDEQTANRRQHRQLGRAIGAGIVCGMEVRLLDAGGPTATPLLAVAGGLAINREGQAIELPVTELHVALRRTTAKPPAEALVFADCQPLQAAPDLVGKGVYLLTAAPTAQYSDRAPMVSLNGGGKADGCGDRYAVEGVSFRLLELSLAELGGVNAAEREELASLLSRSEQNNLTTLARLAARSRLRNMLAHACFGGEELAQLRADIFRSGALHASYGALDTLWENATIQACEVPLALLVWTNAGVRSLDMWAVRRRPHRDEGATPAPGERALAEGEAMREQFADQLAWLLGDAGLSLGQLVGLQARLYMRFLPAAGLLPLFFGTLRGFNPDSFLGGLPRRGPEFVDAARIAALLDSAIRYPPIDLDQGELIWDYRPWPPPTDRRAALRPGSLGLQHLQRMRGEPDDEPDNRCATRRHYLIGADQQHP